ncbi:methyltransferase domain-containing protein [Shinella kummerowiae]|uniref:Protein-L-isoaspartate O-methyltransferase n=1 Tax=Shinella kummerowiae TaxID=417745 RepID=A0A6N8S9G5_9HYPH|nr:protein-L-isoaspartate O-methyltransferase [Shinella kummerowiae]MXN45714.1 methyltransferase domain-containing protein [Shinella kummerowiae]
MDYKAARTKMVDNQIRTTDVTSHEVLDAFLTVAREEFVPAAAKPLAYIDDDIQLVPGRYLMEPSPLAKLIQLADVVATDVVLEVGCGTGYASAILSKLGSSVVAIESDATLAATATETLSRLGYDNVAVVVGDLEAGYAPEAPYDVVFVHGAVEFVPDALLAQLRDGGRFVVVEGYGNASQARLYIKEGGHVSERTVFNTAVKPLPGFRKAKEFVF